MKHELEEERERDYARKEKSSGHKDEAEDTQIRHEQGTLGTNTFESTTSTVLDTEQDDILEEPLRASPSLPCRKGSLASLSLHDDPQRTSRRRRAWNGAKSIVKHTLSPPTISLVCSIIIGVIPQLRNLFVPADPSDPSFSPEAPDGLPPLSTIYDAAAFIGAASVPLGLIILGASIATIEIPRPCEFCIPDSSPSIWLSSARIQGPAYLSLRSSLWPSLSSRYYRYSVSSSLKL